MAPVKESNTPLPRSYVEQYWQLVRKALENIFSKSTNAADTLLQIRSRHIPRYNQFIKSLPC